MSKPTGIFASPEVVAIIKERVRLYRELSDIGVLVRRPSQVINDFAKAQGLPTVSGTYGMNLQTGEFLSPC